MSLLTLVLVFSVAFGVAFTSECPTYWTSYGGYCYRLFGTKKTWHQAEGHCQRLSQSGRTAHLVSIHNSGENAFLKVWMETTRGTDTGRYWIGFNDLYQSDNFRWTDNSAISYYRDWLPHEPNNALWNEHCCEIYKSGGTVGWNDGVCNLYKGYVCKMQK